MDFEYHDDEDEKPGDRIPRSDREKAEITWLTIILWAAVIALLAAAIYFTRDYPLAPPP